MVFFFWLELFQNRISASCIRAIDFQGLLIEYLQCDTGQVKDTKRP